jgi:predicted amidohydrolase YtcJ
MNFWDKKSQGIKTTDLERGIRLVQAEYLSNGITSFEDATSSNNYDDWGILNRLNENGCIKSHTGMLVSPEAMGDFIECGMATSELGQVRICGVKVIVDETDGHVSPDQDTLEKILCEAHAAGFATAQHAIKGKPLEVAVEVIGKVKARTPGTMHHDRIEHCSLCSARIRGRIKNSKLVVVSQPGFIYQNGDRYLQTVKKSELPFLYCFRSFLRDGIMIAAGSDSPFGNPIPLDGIYAAVTRRTESGKAVTPNESIGIMEAVAMWTRSAAWAATLEDRAGIIAAGKRADLVVLSNNLLTCAEERLKEIKVLKTMIDGAVVWDCGN